MTGYIRSRRLVVSSIGTVVSLAITIMFYRSQLTLHFDPEGSAVRLGLLAPIACVIFINVSLSDPVGEGEAIFVSRMRVLRSLHMAGVVTLIALGVLGLILVYGTGSPMGEFVRNSAWLTGLLLLMAAVMSSQQAWVLPVVVVLATYGFGMDYSLGVPHSWAVLLQDLTAANSLSGTFVLVAGVSCFVVRGPRTLSSNEVEF